MSCVTTEIMSQLHAFRKWPIDLIRVVDEYRSKFVLYIVSGTYYESSILERKEGRLSRLPEIPGFRAALCIVQMGRFLYAMGRYVPDRGIFHKFDITKRIWSACTPLLRDNGATVSNLSCLGTAIIATIQQYNGTSSIFLYDLSL